MRKTLFLICLFFFYTCDFDFQLNKKITVNEFIEDELKSFSWNQVDQYPVFENCLNFNDTAQKNSCFVETITENFRINLKKNNLVLNRTLVDTINCPCFIITGENDVNSTPSMAHALSERIKSSKVKILRGLAHGAPIEAPKKFAKVIKEAMAQWQN